MFGVCCNCWHPKMINLRGVLSRTQILRSNFSSNSNDLFQQKYCLDLVQKNDYENFLCTLLLKGLRRRYALAIRAFNVEVAKVGSTVSDEHIGKLKLKFWFDSIDKCFDKKTSYVSDHPVLHELKYVALHNKLTKAYLRRLVKSRERLANQQFLTRKDIEDYAEQSVSPIYYLLLEICNVKDVNVDHAASHLGKAQGITNLLRAIPYRRRNDALNIPQEILIKHNVSQEQIIRGNFDDKNVENCIFDVATMAHQHLEKARNLCVHVPKNVRALFLPAVAIDRYLERLRVTDFKLIDKRAMQRDTMLPIVLYWKNFQSKY